jgi:hypothetical protein
MGGRISPKGMQDGADKMRGVSIGRKFANSRGSRWQDLQTSVRAL